MESGIEQDLTILSEIRFLSLYSHHLRCLGLVGSVCKAKPALLCVTEVW